ncbi:MAG: IS630 family transposase [Armatimonadota bacterium]
MEKRRLKAARLFGKGKSQAEVVRTLGVSRQSVSRWHRAWQREGEAGLEAAGRAGRKPKLTATQIGQVKQELLRGPLAHGYATILWTLPRVARLIATLTGVKYHPGHVWRILRAMDWSLQRPEHRAKERDDEAITRWQKRRWPQRKGGRSVEAPGSSTSTRAASRSALP